MNHPIQSFLVPVQRRQRITRGLQLAAVATTLSAGTGIIWLIANWFQQGVSLRWLMPTLAAIALVPSVLAFAWPVRPHTAARLIDVNCKLKDRATTALQFSGLANRTDIQELQLADARSHLSQVDPRIARPIVAPKSTIWAAMACAGLIACCMLPRTQSLATVASEPLLVVSEQASVLEETMVAELETLSNEEKSPELEELVQELKEMLEELKAPDVDQRDALSKLSEMQFAITEAVKQLDVAQIDAQLQQLAEAMKASDSMKAAAQSMEDGKYERAATELEKMDTSTMTRKDRDAVVANMKKLSQNLGKGKKGELSDAIKEMTEGLEESEESKCKDGQCKAAGVCKKQSTKKKIGECLSCQLNRLSECKGCCQGQCDKPGSRVAKTQSPSSNWNKGVSNSPTGDEMTSLESQRKQENITGMAGDGPSEREVTSTPEAEQDASRAYADKYVEFRKKMEEVIDSEPLPLGHRETVRRYFESIRPTNEQSSAIELKPAAANE
jgi:hypothetical protein